MDTGTTRTFLESAAPRVQCPEHGVLVAHVPWARPGAKCTYLLEDTCAWLAKNMALTAVTVFLRLSWRTVAAIVARVVQDLTGKTDQLDGLTRIGIDEISYRKGHRYLTCVVDHDTGRLVWAHEGRNKDTLTLFFDALGDDQIRSADACLGRRRGMDPRGRAAEGAEGRDLPGSVPCRDVGYQGAGQGPSPDPGTSRRPGPQRPLGCHQEPGRPDRRTSELSLARIKTTNTALYRAYLLKEQLRAVFATKGRRGERTPRRVDRLGHAAPDSPNSSHWPAPSSSSSS